MPPEDFGTWGQDDPLAPEAELALDVLGHLGDRRHVLGALRGASPELRRQAMEAAPDIGRHLRAQRGGALARTAGALQRGLTHGVAQPIAELIGLGGTNEEIAEIRRFDQVASQTFAPSTPDDPWYARGPLQAVEMVPWMASIVGGAGAARGLATRAGVTGAKGLKAAGVGGITAAAFPRTYQGEIASFDAAGISDDVWWKRPVAGISAGVIGAIEGIIENPFVGRIPLTQGAMTAVRQYLWEATKRAPFEASEEYLQGLASGAVRTLVSHMDENAPDLNFGAQLAQGLEEGNEALLPLAFLLGVPAAGGAAISGVRANRLAQLREIRDKGFVTAEDAQAAEIKGNTRRERLEAVDQEIETLETEEAQDAGTVPGPETQVRPDEGSQGVRRGRKDEVPAEPTSQGPQAPEVQPENVGPEQATELPETLFHGTPGEVVEGRSPAARPRNMMGNDVVYADTREGTARRFTGEAGNLFRLQVPPDARILDYQTPEGQQVYDSLFRKAREQGIEGVPERHKFANDKLREQGWDAITGFHGRQEFAILNPERFPIVEPEKAAEPDVAEDEDVQLAASEDMPTASSTPEEIARISRGLVESISPDDLAQEGFDITEQSPVRDVLISYAGADADTNLAERFPNVFEGMSKAPLKDVPVIYRGFRGKVPEVGERLNPPGYSWSKAEDISAAFARRTAPYTDDQGYILQLDNPEQGTDISSLDSEFQRNEEVIWSGPLEVVSVEQREITPFEQDAVPTNYTVVRVRRAEDVQLAPSVPSVPLGQPETKPKWPMPVGGGKPPQSGLVPIVVHDGQIYYGEPGDLHADVISRHLDIELVKGDFREEFSFAGPDGRPLSEDEALKVARKEIPDVPSDQGRLDAKDYADAKDKPEKRRGRKDQEPTAPTTATTPETVAEQVQAAGIIRNLSVRVGRAEGLEQQLEQLGDIDVAVFDPLFDRFDDVPGNEFFRRMPIILQQIEAAKQRGAVRSQDAEDIREALASERANMARAAEYLASKGMQTEADVYATQGPAMWDAVEAQLAAEEAPAETEDVVEEDDEEVVLIPETPKPNEAVVADVTEKRLSEVRSRRSSEQNYLSGYTRKPPGSPLTKTEQSVMEAIGKELGIGFTSNALVYAPQLDRFSKPQRKALLSLLHRGELQIEGRGQDEWIVPVPSAAQAAQQRAEEARPKVEAAGFAGGGQVKGERIRDDEIPDAIKAPEKQERRLRQARGYRKPSAMQRAREAASTLVGVTRAQEHIPNTEQFSAANEFFRLLRNVPSMGQDEAIRTTAAIADPLGPKQLMLFERHTVMENLAASVASGQPLRFGFQSAEEVEAYRKKIEDVAARTPAVQEAIEARREIVRETTDKLIEFGMLPEAARDNVETYYHQQVHYYMLAHGMKGGGTRAGKVGRTFQRRRVLGDQLSDEEMDYNTSYLEAEISWLTDANMEIEKERLLRDLMKKYDIKPQLQEKAKEQNTTWQALAEQTEGYEIFQPEPGNTFYQAFTLPERIIEKLHKDVLDSAELTPDDLRQVLAIGNPKRQFVVPSEIASQLRETRETESPHGLALLADTAMRSWKVYTLLNPKRALAYNLRNMTGDIDPVVAADPSLLRHADQAQKELRAYHGGRLKLSPELRAARDLGVIGSGFVAEEVPDIKDLPVFRRFMSEAGKTALPLRPVKAYMDVVKPLSQWREDTLRYAAFLGYRNQLRQGRVRHYGGSRRAVVDQLRKDMGADVAAAHLARNLLGDYGNISAAGNWIRRRLMPFWSFQEINLKRVPRLLANAYQAGGTLRTAGALSAAAGRAILMSRIAWMFGALWAWNNLIQGGDEEEELAGYDRATPHVILGRNPDGSIRIFRRVGALGDFLEWFGINEAVAMLGKRAKGQVDTSDILWEMAFAMPEKFLNSLRPDLKALGEIPAGVSTFPEPFRPRSVRRDEAASHIVGLTDEYKWMKGKVLGDGSTSRPHYWQRWAIGVVDPRHSALSQMYDLRSKFLKKKGKESKGIFPVSRYKEARDAAKFEDYDAFVAWKRGFQKDRGRKAWNDFRNWTRTLDPIASRLNDRDEREFVTEFLSNEDRERLDVARNYSHEIRDLLITWWWADERER